MLRKFLVAGLFLGAFVATVSLSIGSAFASDQSDVLKRMQQTIDEANQNIDPAKLAENFAPSVVLVDDLAPFVFTGAPEQAIGTWAKAYAADSEQNGISDFSMQLLKARDIEVIDDHAYIVVPAVYRFKQHGKPARIRGTITATLEKVEEKWLISTWAWAAQ
ncbi:DUF4440 domain-containing protein [Paraburkholderia edwinii]|jgi:hypothetical protein|uniref:DUF4440 domain-containing protein n=1 Tax=Paraburkholderia edwinii TaxID=2861782 RepID=A0ABX8UWM7_9BURK|nr:DUF4440 domain-containing protein [Paraburkholderia edwinii]QYD73413.1 DUF4440 domain-containing protein [Paraburkholderia edwinii]